MVILRKKSKGYSAGWNIELVFQIKLHKKDVKLLELIKDYFGGVGRIEQKGSEACAFIVSSLKDITLKVIPHFDNYPLKSKKLADYLLWRQVSIIMGCGEHRTEKGLQDIINLRASINLGLTDKLKLDFPNTVPVIRPNVVNKPLNILSADDCEWVAGFTSGEGSFKVSIKESPRSKVGFQTYLAFYITQHTRDEVLMRSFIDFFGCGHYSIRSDNLQGGDYYCISFIDIQQKIIPFFNKHIIRGIKSEDFKDWCKVAELMQNDAHKTTEGLEIIRQIKLGMNKGREWQ